MILLVKHWYILISIDLPSTSEADSNPTTEHESHTNDINQDLKKMGISDLAKKFLMTIGRSSPSESEIEDIMKLAKTCNHQRWMQSRHNNDNIKNRKLERALPRYS